MVINMEAKSHWLGGYNHIPTLNGYVANRNEAEGHTGPARYVARFFPTVTRDFLVEVDFGFRPLRPKEEEGIAAIIKEARDNHFGCMVPYQVDEAKAVKARDIIINEVRPVDPDVQVAVRDAAGKIVDGYAPKVDEFRSLFAGAPCYYPGADPLQVTLLDGKKEAIYAMRLPVPEEGLMFAVAKAAHPELLAPMARAVDALKLD